MSREKQEEAVKEDNEKKTGDVASSFNEESKEVPTNKMASIAEVFSFARTRKTRLCVAAAFFFACVSGATLPGT